MYHHNNCKIHDKETMINNSKTNLQELNELSKDYNANIVIENAVVISSHNMLFDQDEFIKICKESSHDSISYGKLSMEKFIEIYKKYTEKADLVLEYSKDYREKINILIEDIDYIKSKI